MKQLRRAPITAVITASIIFVSGCTSNNPSYSDQADRAYTETLEARLEDEQRVHSYELLISNVTISSNSSYTKASGTLTNHGKGAVSFVQVKGQFQNSSGTTLDTDWTYAVGSEGLSPGESTKFELAVEKDSSIKKCSCIVLDYEND